MEFELTKQNILVIAGLIVFLIVGTYFGLVINKGNPEFELNTFKCGDQKTPFRANITSCLAFNVSPSTEKLANVLANPTANRVAILIDPNSSGNLGLAAYDIYKIYKSLEPQTNIVPGIAYTYHWQEQPLIPNITIEEATFKSPVIWLQLNQSESKIVVDGPGAYVNAMNTNDLDAAA